MPPLDVVVSFAEEMNEWEYKMYLLGRVRDGKVLNHESDRAAVPDEPYDVFMNTYYDIFGRYCTRRERKFGGHPSSWSKQGTYQGVSRDSLVSETLVQKNKAEVIVTGGEFPDNKFLFVLLNKGDEWRIDNAKWGDIGQWNTHHL